MRALNAQGNAAGALQVTRACATSSGRSSGWRQRADPGGLQPAQQGL